MAQADRVVSLYFQSARQSLIRAQHATTTEAADADRLAALFVLLAGFEAFLNCYFRIIADGKADAVKSKIIALTDSKKETLRGKALKLPWKAFGHRPRALDSVVEEIEQYIQIRHKFMHLKHDWSSVTIDANITISGLMDTTILVHDKRWKIFPLFVAIRRYIKLTLSLSGSHDINHDLDRWTKALSEWRH